MSVVIDATLVHLIQSEKSICEARDEVDPMTIQQFNDVLSYDTGLR
jgi:hypothetical protein